MINIFSRRKIKETKEVKEKQEITKQDVLQFLKKNPLTEDEVLTLYAQTIIDCNDATIAPKFHEEIMKELGKVEGFADYLRLTISKDMQRYFNAQTPFEQLQIKGAANRTLYLKTSIAKLKDVSGVSTKSNTPTTSKNISKDLGIKRYVN